MVSALDFGTGSTTRGVEKEIKDFSTDPTLLDE